MQITGDQKKSELLIKKIYGSHFLKIEDVSNKLNIKVSTIRFLIFNKKIPFIKLGRSIRFDALEIEKWIKDNSFGISDR